MTALGLAYGIGDNAVVVWLNREAAQTRRAGEQPEEHLGVVRGFAVSGRLDHLRVQPSVSADQRHERQPAGTRWLPRTGKPRASNLLATARAGGHAARQPGGNRWPRRAGHSARPPASKGWPDRPRMRTEETG